MPTDQQRNLTVLTEHVNELVGKQQDAVEQITGANRSIIDPGRSMWDTHGLVCAATNFTVAAAEEARRTAGGAFFKVSTELSEKLTAAAADYENVDSASGGNIDRCGI